MDSNEFAIRAEQVKNRLYRIAISYLGGKEMALDAVDEAIYQGFKSIKKLRQPEFFETWLTRILINECKKELRKRKREISYEELPETAVEEYDSLPLKEAIRTLPTQLKEVIILRYLNDYTLEKTAELLKIPRGTVATRQRKALKLLKLELGEKEEAV